MRSSLPRTSRELVGGEWKLSRSSPQQISKRHELSATQKFAHAPFHLPEVEIVAKLRLPFAGEARLVGIEFPRVKVHHRGLALAFPDPAYGPACVQHGQDAQRTSASVLNRPSGPAGICLKLFWLHPPDAKCR